MMRILSGIISQPPAGFEVLLLASSPYAAYNFQQSDYSITAQLADITSNGRYLVRTGTNTLPSGPAFRSTTTKSCDFSVYNSNSDYWKDQTTPVLDVAGAATVFTLSFSHQYTDLTQQYNKVIGWRSSNSTNILSVTSGYTTGTVLSFNVSNSSGTDLTVSFDPADTNVHIYTLTFGSSIAKLYVDGAYHSQVNIGGTGALYDSTVAFQLPGSTSSPSGYEDYQTDHVAMWTRELSQSEVEAIQQAYIAELV